jgi:hypothetical protein
MELELRRSFLWIISLAAFLFLLNLYYTYNHLITALIVLIYISSFFLAFFYEFTLPTTLNHEFRNLKKLNLS